jgi:hypothetical protein
MASNATVAYLAAANFLTIHGRPRFGEGMDAIRVGF